MGRQLRKSELKAHRAQQDWEGSRAGAAWADIHNRLLCQDITRRQELDALIAADNAVQAARSRAWRANVERAKRQKLRRSAELLQRPAATPTAE